LNDPLENWSYNPWFSNFLDPSQERDDGIVQIPDELVNQSASATVIILNSTLFFMAIIILSSCPFPVKGTYALFDCSEGRFRGRRGRPFLRSQPGFPNPV
jgi:hypothetical protein